MQARLLILIIGAILIFGCAGNQDTQAKPSQTQNPSGSPVNATAGMANGTANASLNETKEPEIVTTFANLTRYGVPLQCDVSYTYQGRPVEAKLYLKGPSEIRVESPVGVGQCPVTVTVIKGAGQYVGCDKKQITPGCDWFKSSYDPGKPGSASSFDFSSLEAQRFRCKEWAYDLSKFSTSGQSCELG